MVNCWVKRCVGTSRVHPDLAAVIELNRHTIIHIEDYSISSNIYLRLSVKQVLKWHFLRGGVVSHVKLCTIG